MTKLNNLRIFDLKNHVVVLFILLTTNILAQEPLASYGVDTVGQLLSKKTILTLFKNEEILHQNILNPDGKISVLPKKSFDMALDQVEDIIEVQEVILDSLLGKRFYNIKSSVVKLSKKDLMTYYSSLDYENKVSFLSASATLVQNPRFKNLRDYFLGEFDKLKAIKNTKNRIELLKVSFIERVEYKGAIDSIASFLDRATINDYNYANDDLILTILKEDEERAFDCFKKIINNYLQALKNDPKTEGSLYTLAEKEPYLSFLFSENNEIREAFIDYSLDVFSQGIFTFRDITVWMACLWNSDFLTKNQRQLIYRTTKLYSTEKAIQISKEYKLCLDGIEGIMKYSRQYITDSVRLEDLRYVVNYGFSKEEGHDLLQFIKKNELEFGANSKCYKCYYEVISRSIKTQITRDSILSTFKRLDPSIKIDNIRLLKDYFRDEIHTAHTIRRPFSQFYLTSKLLKEYYGAFWFDPEAGCIPVDYDKLILRFSEIMEKELGEELLVQQVNHNFYQETYKYGDISYSVRVGTSSSSLYNLELPDSGDWYYTNSLINVLNLIFLEMMTKIESNICLFHQKTIN